MKWRRQTGALRFANAADLAWLRKSCYKPVLRRSAGSEPVSFSRNVWSGRFSVMSRRVFYSPAALRAAHFSTPSNSP